MSAFKYIAKRSLIPGHTEGIEYDIERGMAVLTPLNREQTEQSIAQDGTSETMLHRIDETWTLTTVPMNDTTDFDAWQEFIQSVMGGEIFQFDAYGTTAVPDNLVNAIYVPRSYRNNRVGYLRASDAVYQISFRLRLHP